MTLRDRRAGHHRSGPTRDTLGRARCANSQIPDAEITSVDQAGKTPKLLDRTPLPRR